jgi:glycolate oxidase FAD binding subunit
MMSTLSPATDADVRAAVADALAARTPHAVEGGGSKRAFGRDEPPEKLLSLAALSGVTLYEPDELVLTARAGTPLAEIEALLAAKGQMLAFEPPDWGALLGAGAAKQTVGGVVACNLAGPRRFKSGAARDHFLGLKAVSGRGDAFKAGGRVVKNVTGYDMCKLLAGSFGTLAVMTELTLKVVPAPEKTRTLLVFGLDAAAGIAALTEALGGTYDVSGAAHLPHPAATTSSVSYVRQAGASVTALRLEGTTISVAARLASLLALVGRRGPTEELHGRNSDAFWREVANVAPFASPLHGAVWRLSVPPAAGPATVAKIRETLAADAFYDWGGGLVWLAAPDEGDGGASMIRAAVGQAGGHATLVRASPELRRTVAVFEPMSPAVAALTLRIKDEFDPGRILNPGRMYEDSRA